jgi:REP element-mobilizing transposase RayT
MGRRLVRMGKRHRQTEILFRAHGGARRGAGRKRVALKARVLHRPRTRLTGREPVLVTLTTQRAIANLRGRRAMVRILRSLSRAKERLGTRIIHYSVQRDHLHLIVEAEDARSLSRAMQGLSVRIAKALNRTLGRKGKVFADRFHDRVLTSPRQVRHALAYVLCNARKHGIAPPIRGERGRGERGRGGVSASWVDPCSSAAAFDGWSRKVCSEGDVLEVAMASTTTPRIWLLRIGWRRGGLLHPDHCPGRALQ